MNILQIFLLVFFLLTNCTLFNSDNENFQPIFRAEINGELFDISLVDKSLKRVNAAMTNQGGNSYLAVFGHIFNKEFYPYRESISFSLFWDKNKAIYNSNKDSTLIGEYSLLTGGKYLEVGGDVVISTFYSPVDDEGFISANIEDLSDGREIVYGDFEFAVVASEPLNQFSQRIGQDTLHITNGEYRLLLDDRREK